MERKKKIKAFLDIFYETKKAEEFGLLGVYVYGKRIHMKTEVFDEIFPATLFKRESKLTHGYVEKSVTADDGITFFALYDIKNFVDIETIT